jgi:hypothetical protein
MVSDIAAHLASLGLGTVGLDIFCQHMPPLPDEMIGVFEYSGESSELGFSTPGVKYEHPGLQIVCRGTAMDYEAPRSVSELAYRALAEVQAATVGDAFYHLIVPIQTPFLMRRDDKERCMIAFNCRVTKELSA